MVRNPFDTNLTVINEYNQHTPDGLYQLVRHGRLTEIDAYVNKVPAKCCFFTLFNEHGKQKVTLLMLAALNGHDALVRMMLTHSMTGKRRIEQKGCVYDASGTLVENVTALWCALEREHFQVAHTLIHLGDADVNHGPQDTLLVDSVVRGRFDIVYFLVENGYADVSRIDSKGSNKLSCLFSCAFKRDMNTIKYLIARGANINYQELNFDWTLLHIAAEEDNFALVQLLCMAGANSELRSECGDTPLMIAARYGHLELVDYLLEYHVNETTLDDLELVAASIMVSDSDEPLDRSEQMTRLLYMSLRQRVRRERPKTISRPIAAYNYQQECRSSAELDLIGHNFDRLYIEALLIRERILLPQKNITLFEPLSERAILLAEQAEFDRSFSLLLHTFHLYQQMNLSNDLYHFVWLFCRMMTANVSIRGDQLLTACYLVFEPSQRTMEDRLLRDAVCLIAIAAKVLEQSIINNQERHSIAQWVRDLCRAQHRTQNGQTLLHLSVSRQIYYDLDGRSADIMRVLIFPNLGATKLLICYGRRWIDLETVDQVQSNTVLHVISNSYRHCVANENREIVDLLIRAGAHIDCVNANGHTPLDLADNDELRTLLRSTQALPKLKCLCARLITDESLVCDHLWPTTTPLNTFLRWHGGLKRKRAMSDDTDLYWVILQNSS